MRGIHIIAAALLIIIASALAQRPAPIALNQKQQEECAPLLAIASRAQALARAEALKKAMDVAGVAKLPEGAVYVVHSGSLVKATLEGVSVDSSFDPINPVIRRATE